jgi:hypothetical protein
MKAYLFLFLLFFACQAQSQKLKSEVAQSALDFINTLDNQQIKKLKFPIEDTERFNWHFVPKSRQGIPLKDLSANQKKAALTLLKATLSSQGYQKAIGIIQLEIILKELEGRAANDNYRDETKYYFSIFGQPDDVKPWAWRIEGHHLALNFIAQSGKIISATPSFWGANPAIVPQGAEKGKQILKQESELAFQLLHSLTENQKKIAVFAETALPEIITFNNRKATMLEPKGISFNQLDKNQQTILLRLLSEYVKNYPFEFADVFMQKIENAGLEKLHFAWAGVSQWGEGHYYRIQNPVVLIEYDNTQTKANHVHTVVRDLTNDFGEDTLAEHYKKEH